MSSRTSSWSSGPCDCGCSAGCSRRRPRMDLRVIVVFVVLATTTSSCCAENVTSPTSGLRSARRGDTVLGFLECLSAVRGRAAAGRLLSSMDSEESRDAFVGRAISCVKVPVLRSLRWVREAGSASSPHTDLEFWDGAVHLHREDVDAEPPADPRTDEDASRASARSLAADDEDVLTFHDIIVELDRVSRRYSMDVEVYPGVRALLSRDRRSEEAVNLSFKLEGLAEAAKRAYETSAEEDEDEDTQRATERGKGRGIEDYMPNLPGMPSLELPIEDRHGHKKKKILKGLKKLRKKLAPYLPLLAIPLAIQLMLLPLYIIALKMMALKSILLGKMTLILVAVNILRNVQQRQVEDDHNSRVAAEYYGYSDGGLEYGGWVNNRRSLQSSRGRSAANRRK